MLWKRKYVLCFFICLTRPVSGPAPHSGFKMTACVLPKCPFRNKRKRSSRIDFTHRTFAEKGGMLKKARIQKKKVEPYWLYTPDFCWKGGVGWNTHMRTLNNTEWGGGGPGYQDIYSLDNQPQIITRKDNNSPEITPKKNHRRWENVLQNNRLVCIQISLCKKSKLNLVRYCKDCRLLNCTNRRMVCVYPSTFTIILAYLFCARCNVVMLYFGVLTHIM